MPRDIGDEEEEENFDLKSSHETKKRKDLLDDEVESADDLVDDELDLDEEDLMDDVENM